MTYRIESLSLHFFVLGSSHFSCLSVLLNVQTVTHELLVWTKVVLWCVHQSFVSFQLFICASKRANRNSRTASLNQSGTMVCHHSFVPFQLFICASKRANRNSRTASLNQSGTTMVCHHSFVPFSAVYLWLLNVKTVTHELLVWTKVELWCVTIPSSPFQLFICASKRSNRNSRTASLNQSGTTMVCHHSFVPFQLFICASKRANRNSRTASLNQSGTTMVCYHSFVPFQLLNLCF